MYTDSESTLDLLTNDEVALLFRAIFRYVKDGELLVTDDRTLNVVFNMFRIHLDNDADKYEEVCEKRRQAGKRGAAVTNAMRWGNQQMSANDDNNQQMSANVIKSQQTSHDNDIVNDNDNESDIDNDIDNDIDINNRRKNINININAKKEKQQDNLAKRKDTFTQSVKAFATIYGEDMTNEFIDYWTEPNKSGTRMRYELERTWDLSRRLARWSKNNQNHKPINSNNSNENNRTSNDGESARDRSIREANESIERAFAEIDARRLQQNNEEVPDIILPW